MSIDKIVALEDRMPHLKVRTLEQYVLKAIPDDDVRDRAGAHVTRRELGPLVLLAQVHRGRWVVFCTACTGGQFASRADHRYWCTQCHNAMIGHRWAAVDWPPDADVAAIEAALLARPDPATRNWLPHESVADLLRETAEHTTGADA